MGPRRRLRPRAHRGQALIEFSLIALMMIYMFFGVFEFGRAFHAHLQVSHAARDGARVAIDPGATDAEITNAAQGAAEPLTLSNVAISRSGGSATITATYTFESPVPLISEFWGGGPLTISRTMTSRVNS